ncbi:MAG: sigma-70 family RNA polymerase sigma factor [Treponema sp.]|jgi:RNA polymerase sigma factor|nr:sigma-70 family RNA polymerase sigma factor [Treponema sp.]
MNEQSPDFTEKIALAKTDKQALNRIIVEYMPFIKKCVSGVFFKKQPREDNLTEAMLGFIHSVQTYQSGLGNFIAYAQTVIRNRLIDAARREANIQKPLFSISAAVEEKDILWEYELSQRNYDIAEEQKNLQLEIIDINSELARWGFDLKSLIKNCPKQDRSRRVCHGIAQKALEDRELVAEMLRTRRAPVKQLASAAGCSEKIVDKYRRYIAAVIIIAEGNYPYIHSFLPRFFDQEESL